MIDEYNRVGAYVYDNMIKLDIVSVKFALILFLR